MIMRRMAAVIAATVLGIATAAIAIPSSSAAPASSTPTYSGFVVEGGPDLPDNLSNAPAAVRTAVLQSARTGQEAIYNDATGTYSMASTTGSDSADRTGVAPSSTPDTITPDSVTGGFHLPGGTRYSDYRFNQNTATKLGVVRNSDGAVVGEVDIKFVQTITGGSSSYWKYAYSLSYKKGGLYRLNVRLTCAVNETGRPDDYCTSITYPNGAKDTNVSASHVTEVHDLAIGNTVQTNPTGFFGHHSTPPPTGSAQVKKYAHLTENAYFSDYGVTDQALVRGWDVCVPKKATFSGVKLCQSSGTGY